MMSYESLGTTVAIPVQKDSELRPSVKPGEGYFLIRIHSAQVAYHGPFWEKVNSLIVVSETKVSRYPFDQKPVKVLNCARPVRRNRTESLGIANNLINLVPAEVDHVSVSIQFLLDRQNRLSPLASLINDGAFVAALSFAPGAAAVASKVGNLSEKVISSFMEGDSQKPILNFVGDFNLAGDGIKEAYYVILGSNDDAHPLPRPLPHLSIDRTELYADDRAVKDLSYVVLDVTTSPVRKRGLGKGTPWYAKLGQAESIAESMAADYLASEKDRQRAALECRKLITEADLLIQQDALYLHAEAKDIIRTAYQQTNSTIFATDRPAGLSSAPVLDAEIATMLDVTSQEDLTRKVSDYQKISDTHIPIIAELQQMI